jgi:hypothetical protein
MSSISRSSFSVSKFVDSIQITFSFVVSRIKKIATRFEIVNMLVLDIVAS